MLINVIKTASAEGAEVLRLAQQGRIELYASTIVLVEVMGKRRADPFDQVVNDRVLAILEHPSITMVECGRLVGYRARELSISHKLKPMDAIHLASALEAGADVFMTDDAGFPLGTYVDRTWVDLPYSPGPAAIPGL